VNRTARALLETRVEETEMTPTDSRSKEAQVPNTERPDGSRVSNWSKATRTAPGKRTA